MIVRVVVCVVVCVGVCVVMGVFVCGVVGVVVCVAMLWLCMDVFVLRVGVCGCVCGCVLLCVVTLWLYA